MRQIACVLAVMILAIVIVEFSRKLGVDAHDTQWKSKREAEDKLIRKTLGLPADANLREPVPSVGAKSTSSSGENVEQDKDSKSPNFLKEPRPLE